MEVFRRLFDFFFIQLGLLARRPASVINTQTLSSKISQHKCWLLMSYEVGRWLCKNPEAIELQQNMMIKYKIHCVSVPDNVKQTLLFLQLMKAHTSDVKINNLPIDVATNI